MVKCAVVAISHRMVHSISIMSGQLEAVDRVVLFHDSRPTSSEEIRARALDWRLGNLIASGLVAVGQITPVSDDERQLLDELRFREYDFVGNDEPLYTNPVLQGLERGFRSIVDWEMRRSGIDALVAPSKLAGKSN